MQELPAWLTPLPDAASMREVDRWAIEQRGVPGVELMERAGAAVAAAVEELAPDGRVAVLAGKGNNGGDGLVAARLLRQAGREVDVFATAAPEEWRGDAAANLQRLPGEPPRPLEGPLGGCAAIVDALLGTGFAGEPHGSVAEAIAAIDGAEAPVVSVDVPSGVDASTGEVAGAAVRAACTVTFHAAKPGLWIRPGKAHAGRVRVADIGVPRGAPMAATAGLIEDAVLELLPRREAASTKFASGQVVLVGGSVGLSGAPMMAARAAMRAGAGYVTALVPASLQPVLASAGPHELMSRGLAERDGGLDEEALEPALEALRRAGALALGPGLGRRQGSVALARALAARAQVPAVIDADGLNAHAGALAELAGRAFPTVLTPHAGELGRLLERSSEQIERARLAHARRAAELADAVVVLKGDDTLVADPSGRVAISPGGSPALATAGTGDVLTGVIAALLAQGVEPFAAAAAGVLLHVRAGRLAVERAGSVEAVIASDVIEALGRARTHGGLEDD